MRTLIIKAETRDKVKGMLYDWLKGGRFREVVKVEEISPNYIHVVFVPELGK